MGGRYEESFQEKNFKSNELFNRTFGRGKKDD